MLFLASSHSSFFNKGVEDFSVIFTQFLPLWQLKIPDKTLVKVILNIDSLLFNPFQPSVTFHIETSPNQMTGFYMKCNNGLKCVTHNLHLLPINYCN